MFFFKNMMMAYMGNDFDRGLRMLKDLCESGTVWAKSEYKGEKNYDEFYVVGKKTSCPISDISTHIRNDFMAIDTLLKQQKLSTPEGMITVSHVHDIPKGVCTFTAGLIYKSKDGVTIPAGYEIFKIDSHKGLAVDHYGPYRHIGNAWSMAVSYQRGLKKKVSKTPPAYEIYKTIPGQVAEKDLYTQITMPIK
ncbi:MAG: GyrI-like domain-containing protein, partial [Pseudobdellovibrio sp.]